MRRHLDKGFVIKRHSWKGVRRVELGRGSEVWSKCTRVFAWVSPWTKEWRQRVGEKAAALRVKDYDGLKRKLGRKWAYDLRETIPTVEEEEWREFVRYSRGNQTPCSRESRTFHRNGRLTQPQPNHDNRQM